MRLAQRPQRSEAGEARTGPPRSRVKHSTTETLCSQKVTLLKIRRAAIFYSHDSISVVCLFVCLFVCFDSLHPSQQFYSHVRTGLPGFNHAVHAKEKVTCSRTHFCREYLR